MTMDPNKRMTDLITLSTRLIQVLARENAALRTKRTHEVAALVNEKATLTRAYESRARGFLDQVERARLEHAREGRDRPRRAGRGRVLHRPAREIDRRRAAVV